jgi:hypothetical protein
LPDTLLLTAKIPNRENTEYYKISQVENDISGQQDQATRANSAHQGA